MKPDWDKLMGEFSGSADRLVADVDCTAAGKPLCDKNDVKGFPTLKWGDPNNLEDYEGGRDYDSLKKFAEEKLGPTCGPNNMELCDDDQKSLIKKFQGYSAGKLDAKIRMAEKKIKAAEALFKEEVDKLQAKHKALSEDKDAKMDEIKKSGLGLMKAVAAHNKKSKSEL